MLYFVIRETKLEKRVIQTYSTKNNPCQKYPQKTWVMRKINQYYLDNFNCTIIFIKDGLNMSSNSEYCNISLHVHFQKHYDQMYNDNLVDCPSAQSCTHIDYRLHVAKNMKIVGTSIIGIMFYKPVVEYHIEEISYDFQSLIGEVGGTMGLTVGLSFLSIFEWILDLFKKYKI